MKRGREGGEGRGTETGDRDKEGGRVSKRERKIER